MLCFIYKSLKKGHPGKCSMHCSSACIHAVVYLYVDQKDDFSKLPRALFDSLGVLQFVMALELTQERKLAKEDAGKVLDSLNEKGFFVQLPPRTLPAPLKDQ